MAILTFSLSKDEFLSGRKTVTRRDWKPSHMANWQRWYDEGRRVHDAYDRLPIVGDQKIGHFRLTARPCRKRLSEMPAQDLEAEGGMVDTRAAFYEMIGLPPAHEVTVIRLGPFVTKRTDLGAKVRCSS